MILHQISDGIDIGLKRLKIYGVMNNSIIIFLLLAVFSIALTSCGTYKSRYSYRFGNDGLIYNSHNDNLFTGTVLDTADVVIEFQVVNGKKNGLFKTTYLNGQVEKLGYIINNDNVGKWEYYDPDGQLESEGSFQNDAPEGRWVSYYRNGNKKCEGNFKKGKRENEWIYYNEKGEVINVVIFRDGEFVDLQERIS